MTGRVFISYRRQDSSGFARAIYNELRGHLDPDGIFMDVDTIEPGLDFVKAIEDAVGRCSILLALIGPQWLDGGKEKGHRLHAENDYVRTEISTALKRDIRVIPVLVDGGLMPASDDLPEELAPLTRRNALEIRHSHFDADVAGLIDVLVKLVKPKQKQSPPAHKAVHTDESSVQDATADMRGSRKPQWMWRAATILFFVFLGLILFRFVDGLRAGTTSGRTIRPEDALMIASATVLLSLLIMAIAVRSGRSHWWVSVAFGIPAFTLLAIGVMAMLEGLRTRGDGPLVCAIAIWIVGLLVITGQALYQRRRLKNALKVSS